MKSTTQPNVNQGKSKAHYNIYDVLYNGEPNQECQFSVTIILEFLEFDFNLKKQKQNLWCPVRNREEDNVNKVTTDDLKQMLPPTVSHTIFYFSFTFSLLENELSPCLAPRSRTLRSPGKTSVATPRSREITCTRGQQRQRCLLLYVHKTMAFHVTNTIFG